MSSSRSPSTAPAGHSSQVHQDVMQIQSGLAETGYIATQAISTCVFLAKALNKPILIEGPAGVGKTDLARATAESLALPLIRLQCYEGLDESKALYEWRYGKQLLYTQLLKEKLAEVLQDAETLDDSFARILRFDDIFFSENFLAPRPLLQALREDDGAVLLIDEIDKADEEFEAFLLEILADFQVSVPELGTIRAKTPPLVFLTSNNTREMGDALKRRCLHLHIDFPDPRLEERIIESRVPDVGDKLRRQLVSFVQQVRGMDIKKAPSVSETIDWARTLVLLHAHQLDTTLVKDTLNVLLKFENDIETAQKKAHELIRNSAVEAGFASHTS